MNINDFGMPLTSVGGDRKYGSADWREYYRMLVENGIIGNITNELQVKPQVSPNKTVYVDEGAIMINGVTRIVDSTIDLSLSENTSGFTRIDRIVARLNLNEDIRKLEFAVVEGTPDTGAPALTRNEIIYEMALAQVELANGFSTITASNITDERLVESLCGYFRYRAKPAWYPQCEAPMDAWMYLMFKNLLTEEEISDIEANSSLMSMINGSTLSEIDAKIKNLTIRDLQLMLNDTLSSSNIDAWADLLDDTSRINSVDSSGYSVEGGFLKSSEQVHGISNFQSTQSDSYSFGGTTTTSDEKIGQYVYATPGTLREMRACISISGSPNDQLKMSVYASDRTTLIGESLNFVTATSSQYDAEIFYFDNIPVPDDGIFFASIWRTGAIDDSNYYKAWGNYPVSLGKPYLCYYNDGNWNLGSTSAYMLLHAYVYGVPDVVWNKVDSTEPFTKVAVSANETLNTGTITYYLSEDGLNWAPITNLDTLQSVTFSTTDVYLRSVITGDAELHEIAWGGY